MNGAHQIPEQVVIPAAMVGFAYLAVSVAVLVIFGTAAFAAWRRDRRDQQHDVGPDALLLLEDLDAHLNQQFAQLSGLYERLGPPDLEAGCDRLRAALRDDREDESA